MRESPHRHILCRQCKNRIRAVQNKEDEKSKERKNKHTRNIQQNVHRIYIYTLLWFWRGSLFLYSFIRFARALLVARFPSIHSKVLHIIKYSWGTIHQAFEHRLLSHTLFGVAIELYKAYARSGPTVFLVNLRWSNKLRTKTFFLARALYSMALLRAILCNMHSSNAPLFIFMSFVHWQNQENEREARGAIKNNEQRKRLEKRAKNLNPWATPNKCLESNLNRSEKPKHKILKEKTQTKSIY